MGQINTEEIDLRPTWHRLRLPLVEASPRTTLPSWTGELSGLRQIQNESRSQKMPYIVGAVVIVLALALVWPSSSPRPIAKPSVAPAAKVIPDPVPTPPTVTADPAGRRLQVEKSSKPLGKKHPKARRAF